MVGLFPAPSMCTVGVKEEGKEEAILAGTQPVGSGAGGRLLGGECKICVRGVDIE